MRGIRIVVAALFCVALVATVTAQDPKAERKFDLKFKDGDKLVPFYQEMSTEVTQVIKVQGQDLTQKQSSTFWFQWTPTEEKKEMDPTTKEEVIKWTLKQKIEGLKMSIDISGNPIHYDSRDKGEVAGAAGNPGLLDFFKNLKDAEFSVTLGKNYKVEKVDGKEAFIKKLGGDSKQMEGLLNKVLTEEALKEMADPTGKIFPDTPKKIGEKWEKKVQMGLGPIGKYELKYDFVYVGIGDEKTDGKDRVGKDKIEVETTITYTPPDAKEAGGDLVFRIKEGSKLTSEKTEKKSTIWYDPKAQLIEEARIYIKLKGDLIVTIGGTDTKVELLQEQTTTIKSKDKSFIATDAPKDPKPTDPIPPKKP
jgi:Family of unknown function (DUF6263)